MDFSYNYTPVWQCLQLWTPAARRASPLCRRKEGNYAIWVERKEGIAGKAHIQTHISLPSSSFSRFLISPVDHRRTISLSLSARMMMERRRGVRAAEEGRRCLFARHLPDDVEDDDKRGREPTRHVNGWHEWRRGISLPSFSSFDRGNELARAESLKSAARVPIPTGLSQNTCSGSSSPALSPAGLSVVSPGGFCSPSPCV